MKRSLGIALGVILAMSVAVPLAFGKAAQPDTTTGEHLGTVAFASTRDGGNTEIYLADPMVDTSNRKITGLDNLRRRTNNSCGDGLPAISPAGKTIVFDSNRTAVDSTECLPINVSELFVMGMDGEEETHLISGSSATWSPDSKNIAFHASASGNGTPINNTPGAATTDSDIFVINVDDSIEAAQAGVPPERKNLTAPPQGTPRTKISDDADWSPDGETLIFTSKNVTDKGGTTNNYTSAEIYKINADGTTEYNWERLTNNALEERGPAFSPDGNHILYSCRRPSELNGYSQRFELCIMDADGTNEVQLTFNDVLDLTADWSPDGNKIVFHRGVGLNLQLYVLDLIKDSDGAITGAANATQLTQFTTDGTNLFPTWGECKVGCDTK